MYKRQALTGLVAWYKPETLAASYANGDPISTWADSSGNSRDLTGTTTTRPLALASAINGYMAADFDGTDDILSSASYTHSGTPNACVVLQHDSMKNFQAVVGIDGNSPPVHACDFMTLYGYSTGSYLIANYPGANAYTTYSGSPVSAGAFHIITGSVGADGDLLRVDGKSADKTELRAGAYAATTSGTAYIHLGDIGLGNSMDGKVAEVVIWTDTFPSSSISWVEGYLAHKYAITLADGHLFKNAAPENAPTAYNAAGGATGSSRLVNGGLVD